MKESKWKQFLGVWNTKTIVGVAIGAALFGVLMVFGGIKIFSNTSLTSGSCSCCSCSVRTCSGSTDSRYR